LTQKVDSEDNTLGFFHSWLSEFAKHYKNIIVICLELGVYDLPENIKVLSLGKEIKKSNWFGYAFGVSKSAAHAASAGESVGVGGEL